MPNLDIDMFDSEPKVGDKIKVIGKIKSISDEGVVEASYDAVTIINDKKNRSEDDSNDDSNDNTDYKDDGMPPDSQSLDSALSKAFPNTQ